MPLFKYAAAITALCLAAPALAADLIVNISGVKSRKGSIVVCLWADKDGFPICPKDAPSRQVAPAANTASFTFAGLEQGQYAVTAFHDKDGNGKLKQNFIGIPKEPAVVSGPKQKRMGPPKFEGAAFQVEGDAAIALAFN